nr:T9SS-dependent M36 family metallopeptidase [uncultured Flavobacterium sp.]
MGKITLSLLLLVSAYGFSQSPNEKIQGYLNSSYQKLGLTKQDVSDWILESEANSETTKINNYYIKQRHQGIEIFSGVSNVWVKNGEVINVADKFIPNAASKINTATPVLSAIEAVGKAKTALRDVQGSYTVLETINTRQFVISNGLLTEDPIRAELVYQETDSNTLRLAWDLNFYSQDYKHLWSVRIDAVNGNLLEKHDWVISCAFGDADHKNHNHNAINFTDKAFKVNPFDTQSGSYRVFPFNIESPNHGARQLITTPHNVTASPYGWHDTNGAVGAEYTTTRGNNVWAMEDADGDGTGNNPTTGGAGVSPDGTASLTFDFPYGGTGVAATTYTSAATTNLFYMNNIMHDIFYQYGFNEANGNFQQNNYGKGSQPGITGDAVIADSQDGGGTNNANFATPVDGTRPRMQMYLWDVGPQPTIVVSSPPSVAGTYTVRDNNFSPGHVALPAAPAGISGAFVLFDDGTPDNSDACTAAVNAAALNGKIAVIRRGTCTFVEKVLFAQNAGAIAAVIINNVDGTIIMGGADASITIPAVSMTMAEGEALIAAMATATVNATISGAGAVFVNSDGDFDNGVIAHEYGHGISTRLAGGPANSSCLQTSEQQGEGWSDFFALMLQLKPGDTRNDARGIGTFVMNQTVDGPGIREYKYSTDMSVNPHTFGDTNDMWYNDGTSDRVDVHAVGSVWCAMLWDLAWNYMDKYGYDSNIYNGTGLAGNQRVVRLVLDAIKLQPCGPSFVTARNAIIAADQATTGGQDYCLIWETFARRGLGQNATSGTNSGVAGIQDQVEDFTVPAPGPNCTLGTHQFQNGNGIRVYPNPTKGILNVAINDYFGKISIQVFDLNGRKVHDQEVNDFNTESSINLNNLQTGMYLIKVNGDNVNYTQKIILN